LRLRCSHEPLFECGSSNRRSGRGCGANAAAGRHSVPIPRAVTVHAGCDTVYVSARCPSIAKRRNTSKTASGMGTWRAQARARSQHKRLRSPSADLGWATVKMTGSWSADSGQGQIRLDFAGTDDRRIKQILRTAEPTNKPSARAAHRAGGPLCRTGSSAGDDRKSRFHRQSKPHESKRNTGKPHVKNTRPALFRLVPGGDPHNRRWATKGVRAAGPAQTNGRNVTADRQGALRVDMPRGPAWYRAYPINRMGRGLGHSDPRALRD